MILNYITTFSTCKNMLRSSAKLAGQLGKAWSVSLDSIVDEQIFSRELNEFLLNEKIAIEFNIIKVNGLTELVDVCENNDVSFLFIQLSVNKNKWIQQHLNECRNLRIPYLFYNDSFGQMNIEKVILPVNFLEEEVEKAQFASAFGRFCNAKITLLLANDYGTKAAKNADKMIELFSKFKFLYETLNAKSDSFKVETEAVLKAENEMYDIVIVSTSRDYGLDDLIFGPKELHIIKKSNIPVLLVNPRGDLYALCD